MYMIFYQLVEYGLSRFGRKNTNGNWREFFISIILPCLQQSVLDKGLKALDLTLDFDEMAVLNENKTYIVNTLDVSTLTFLVSSYIANVTETRKLTDAEHKDYCNAC